MGREKGLCVRSAWEPPGEAVVGCLGVLAGMPPKQTGVGRK